MCQMIFVKEVLTQNDPEGCRGKWIAALLEYDLEIKPTKLIKIQGRANQMADYNLHALGIKFIAALSNEQTAETLPEIAKIFSLSPWYVDIIYILQHFNPPPGMPSSKERSLKLKELK